MLHLCSREQKTSNYGENFHNCDGLDLQGAPVIMLSSQSGESEKGKEVSPYLRYGQDKTLITPRNIAITVR